jgi:hypothetical protein
MKLRLFALFLAAASLLTVAQAPAAVDLSLGIRHAVDTGTIDDCNAKAQESLATYLQAPTQTSPGEWLATGPLVQVGNPDITASGTVHCYPGPKGTGYVVSFTCAVETPNNIYPANQLCLDIAHHFYGGAETALATPTPLPTGCTTGSLIGTWQNDNDSKMSVTMTPDGELTDSENVAGSWVLHNDLSAIITYYGNHNMTLSQDGKHLRGGGYSFTRKC